MYETWTQERRLEYLVEAFKAESPAFAALQTPPDTEGRRRMLRALMNQRMPRPLPEETLRVQDEYLRERAAEKGIVSLRDIPELRRGISLWQGDITRLSVDAIVNAANSQMLGCFVPLHSCIDNCIHSFAGVQLREECALEMARLRAAHGEDYEQPTAVPMLTDAYNLPAKKVIHIVGPIVERGLKGSHVEALAACYRNVLELCADSGLRTVAFCCISTGVFRFPGDRAAQIAVRTVTDWLDAHEGRIERVIFNVFKDEDKEYYERELS